MADVIETDLTTDPPTVTERAFTPEELAQREKDAADYAAAEWDRLRAERDRRLAACDWRVMPDAPDYGLVYYRDLWVQYRQALRDLPANTSDPREAVWPEEPSA